MTRTYRYLSTISICMYIEQKSQDNEDKDIKTMR